MALTTAGFIDGSRIHGETLRRALYASTNGATGVTRSGDLAVFAYATPAAGVVIAPGAGIIATRYTDADPGQSYSVTNDEAFHLPVPANDGTSSRRWEVIVRVTDPQYAGESIPTDPAGDSYSRFELVSSLPTNRPFLHLATVVLPANTGVVQRSYITSQRRLANPRSERYLKAVPITVTDHLDAGPTSWEQWPDQAIWPVYVPEWATEVRAVCTWQNVASMPGTNISELSVQLGWDRPDVRTLSSTHMVLGYSTAQGSAEQRRQTVGVADTIPVPAGWRGQAITVMSLARKKEGTVNLIADSWASVSLDLQFVEHPLSEGAWN